MFRLAVSLGVRCPRLGTRSAMRNSMEVEVDGIIYNDTMCSFYKLLFLIPLFNDHQQSGLIRLFHLRLASKSVEWRRSVGWHAWCQ